MNLWICLYSKWNLHIHKLPYIVHTLPSKWTLCMFSLWLVLWILVMAFVFGITCIVPLWAIDFSSLFIYLFAGTNSDQYLFYQVLDYLNASPKNYRCMFTSGATAALKLIGECFPWSSESCYMYTMENHNSVLGIREYPSKIE